VSVSDPGDEHDFGSLEVAGERVMFKIDYCDRAMADRSSDAADSDVTSRVLAIILVSEY
jgi:hypothetical protein